MSYALRNTLILLTSLVLLAGGGWLYISYSMDSTISEQEAEIALKQTQLDQLNTKANDYLIIQERHATLKYQYENHNKELLIDNNVATVYEYLRRINRGPAYTVMNFSLQDSVLNEDHGIIRVRLDGLGDYDSFYNFLMVLEQSKPITRVTDIRIAPTNNQTDLNEVQFEMNVQMYYARGNTNSDPELLINTTVPPRLYNPLYPLVHEVPANTQNLPDVDQLQLIGLTVNGAYIIDQNREFMFLPTGSQVYLGRLSRVNPSQNSATFSLNRGGISDIVTVSVNQRQ